MSVLGKYYLDETYVHKVWNHWAEKNGYRYSSRYHRSHRTVASQRFEDWLFAQGISVIRQDNRYYLKFSDEQTCVVMAFKYG